jgi:hypothetical protein
MVRLLFRTFRILLKIIFTPLLLAVVLVCTPFILFRFWRAARRLGKYCIANDGKIFLICSRRRGWNELLVNNLIPVVEDSATVCWVGHGPSESDPTVVPGEIATRIRHCTKPLVVLVTRRGLMMTSLNGPLQQWKTRGRKNPRSRKPLRRIFDSAVRSMPRA